jgi:hypothetical protein
VVTQGTRQLQGVRERASSQQVSAVKPTKHIISSDYHDCLIRINLVTSLQKPSQASAGHCGTATPAL